LSSNIFVCFIGIDGSGKTTLANKVFETYKDTSKLKFTYGRFVPILTRVLMYIGKQFFLKNNLDMFSDYDKYLEDKKLTLDKHKTLTRLFIRLVILEYFLEILFKIIIPMKLGYSVISDRYVYDTIINDICIDLGLTTKEANLIIKDSWKFIPRPDITFLVKTPEDVAFGRKSDIPSISYLKKRNTYYNSLQFSEIVILDGTNSFLHLQNETDENLKKIGFGKSD